MLIIVVNFFSIPGMSDIVDISSPYNLEVFGMWPPGMLLYVLLYLKHFTKILNFRKIQSQIQNIDIIYQKALKQTINKPLDMVYFNLPHNWCLY